jgi:hypothetical protein
LTIGATGGNGGIGYDGANGGVGGAVALTNTLTGSTYSYGGTIYVTQTATGGTGGYTSGGIGISGGGSASSTLTLDDTKAAAPSTTITMSNTAYGGNGGYAYSGGTGGAGKDATAATTVTGAQSVTSNVYAYGGNGGGNSGGTDGASGNATATSTATSTDADVTSSALAKGGASHVGDGTASATATGTGITGTVHAESHAGNASITGNLVTATDAFADAPVSGASTAKTSAAIGVTSAAFDSSGKQSIAQITGAPTAGDVSAILLANPAINFGVSPVYFGIGELGGAYSTNDTGTETETSQVKETVDLTKAGTLHDLFIGFYNFGGQGNLATDPNFSMTFDVNINGADHSHTFTTVAAANAYFSNSGTQTQDYGSLVGLTSLQLNISLSITDSAATNGYDLGMLIGDPPPAHVAAALNNLGTAIATFGTGGSGSSGTLTPQSPSNNPTLQGWHTA